MDEICNGSCSIRMDLDMMPLPVEPSDFGVVDVGGGRPSLVSAPEVPQFDQGWFVTEVFREVALELHASKVLVSELQQEDEGGFVAVFHDRGDTLR